MYDDKKARQQWQNKVNNAQGHYFESYIVAGCECYRMSGKAEIDKTPEPFRVMKKHQNGEFTGRFIANAQPDFQGTLAGGRSICFEAKYTSTEKLKRDVVTDTQLKALEYHAELGALTGVCAGIQDKFFFIPWNVWRDMKALYKRKYVTAEDVKQYQVRFTGAVMFLDYTNKAEVKP